MVSFPRLKHTVWVGGLTLGGLPEGKVISPIRLPKKSWACWPGVVPEYMMRNWMCVGVVLSLVRLIEAENWALVNEAVFQPL